MDLEEIDEPARLFEWTPERAAALVKAGGYVLHTADGMTNAPGGERLWKATDEDAAAAGEPLARILNRYDSARRLVGMVDEAEFGAAMLTYAKRNLRLRGALVRQEKARARDERPVYGPTVFDDMHTEPPPPETFRVESEPEPVEPFGGEEDANQPAPFAFDPWAPHPR